MQHDDPTLAAAKISLSKWIVFLIAARPLLNQLAFDTSLATIGNYKLSILSLWSIALLGMVVRRATFGPPISASIRLTVLAFLFVVVVFGVPRILLPEALITDVVVYCQFFLTALTARGVIEDVGIDYILKRITITTVALLVMHVTAPVWAPLRDMSIAMTDAGTDPDTSVSVYLGAFQSKHTAAMTFLTLIPFLTCKLMRDRNAVALALVTAVALFMVLAGQRVAMLTFVVFVLSLLFINRRLRLLAPLVVIGAVLIATIPSENFKGFIEHKVEADLEAIRTSDFEGVGEGRLAIAFLAQSWYFESSSPFEQLLGRGTAQAYQLHYLVGGVLSYSHIQVIELMINYGLIGTLLVFLALTLIGRSKFRSLQTDRSPVSLVGAAMLITVFSMLFYAMPLQDGGTTVLLAFWLFPGALRGT